MLFSVTKNKCTGCGACLDVCPVDAIRVVQGHAEITMECMGCGACPRVCPEGAIKKTLPAAVRK